MTSHHRDYSAPGPYSCRRGQPVSSSLSDPPDAPMVICLFELSVAQLITAITVQTGKDNLQVSQAGVNCSLLILQAFLRTTVFIKLT